MNEKIQFCRVKELPGLELYRGIDIARRVSRHVHWVFSLGICEAGMRIHETKKEKYRVTPGSITVVNPDESHSNGVPAGSVYTSRAIRLDPLLLRSSMEQICGQPLDHLLFPHPVMNSPQLARRIMHLYHILDVSPSRLEKEDVFWEVMAALSSRCAFRQPESAPPGNEKTPVARVCEYLQDCFHENTSLESLASIARLSPFHLSRVFTKEIGVPPHAYQLQVRLQRATGLLASGKPLAEIALETGFCDQSHFHKAFKRKFGISPGQYNR